MESNTEEKTVEEVTKYINGKEYHITYICNKISDDALYELGKTILEIME